MNAVRPFQCIGCEVATDNLTRQLYATDASIYQIEPLAVAFPHNPAQARAALLAARESGIPVIPRGAGSGLVGGAIGQGLVIDFSRHNTTITDLDLETRTVRVGAGVVLDQLNECLKLHGFRFGPDVATSSRATLGGMIANNSSGSHVPVYGTTAGHVQSLDVLLSDGRLATLGPGHPSLAPEREAITTLIQARAPEIERRMPMGLLKRWPGYDIHRYLREPDNLGHLLAGSEGTLAAILSARLRIVPIPARSGIGLVFFPSVAEAMQATVELLDLKPAAIEHIDRLLFDQTRGQLAFQAARDLLELDARPCESILIVEFFDDVPERLQLLRQKGLGLRTTLLTQPPEINRVWALRKAGLSLLTGCKGAAKPVTGIEDTAVRPEQLPEYVASLQGLLDPLGLKACFYGHAAAGLLHVRPVLDLHSSDDLARFRQLANEVSALVRQFKGSLAGEHGVGIARTEFMTEQLGPELVALLGGIKETLDPACLFNPGKVIPTGRFRIDAGLRQGPERTLQLPFRPTLAFAARDESLIGNLEQCNGCGGCRKATPTMCPTFIVTGDELMSTRGRANLIRAALEQRGIADPLRSEELEAALSNCLSCKACTTECPSNVNLALIKAELTHARYQRDGLPLRQRVLSSVDLLGRLGCLVPRLANQALRWPTLRQLLSKLLGLAPQRPLPPYTTRRFDRWFTQPRPKPSPGRGPVILWDDTFVRYHEPQIGIAAVHFLEQAGYEVRLAVGRQCCGRPAFSQGNLDKAARLGAANLALLHNGQDHPIVFLEPSCYSMFVEDYRELSLPHAGEVSGRCHLFEQFADQLLKAEPGLHPPPPHHLPVAIHAHCHAKSLLNPAFMTRLAGRTTSGKVTLLETGCCGMAGAFGALTEKYALSIQVARPLIEQLNRLPQETVIVASGTSCRHQIEHLTGRHPLHMAELLAAHPHTNATTPSSPV